MEPPDCRRNMYLPMEALSNHDILSRLGNVRFVMVPKDAHCGDLDSQPNILADDSDWMMAEKNKPRSPPISPAVPWSRTTFDFKSPDVDSASPLKHSPDTRDTAQMSNERSPIPVYTPDNRVSESLYQTPQYYQQQVYRDEKLLNTKRQLFRPDTIDKSRHVHNNQQGSDRLSQLYSLIQSTNAESNNIPSSPVLSSPVQPNTTISQHSHHCHCHHSTSSSGHHASLSPPHNVSKRRKLESFVSSCKKENEPRKSPSCTCSMMEEHFLQMAETAYKNIRRKDTSPASFEQFKRELTHTNDILKESVDIVSQIKEMCEHLKA